MMHKLFPLLLIATLLFQTACSSDKLNGIVYVTWSDTDYLTPASDESIAALAELSVGYVEVLVTWYQDQVNDTYIYPASFSPTTASLAHAVEQIQQAGMQVVLKPHVDCLCRSWRGDIGNQFTTELQWSQWFGNYTAYIVSMATFSAQYNVTLFNVGTELAGTSYRTSDWRDVIAAVRNVYSGPLVYGSNWGSETLEVQFWDALDYIGVDAYYPMANTSDPPLQDIVASWQPIVIALQTMSTVWSKKVIFTEIGYRSYPLAAVAPYQFQGSGQPDMLAQYNLYLAVLQYVYPMDFLAGVFWWAWETSAFNGGPCDNGYNPCRKPAAALLGEYYSIQPSMLNVTNSVSPPQLDDQTMLYANGTFTSGWWSCSSGGSFDSQNSSSPYPGHNASYSATDLGIDGFIGVCTGSANISTNAVLQFNLDAANSSSQYAVSICTCSDCSTCTQAPILINQFLPAAQTCRLATSWQESQVSIPIAFFQLNTPWALLTQISIFNVGTDGIATSLSFDNMRLLS